MRRALVIAGVMLAGLLAMVPTLAAAAPAPRQQEELEEEEVEFLEEEKGVTFTLLSEGFTVDVLAEDNDGDQTATMSVSRDGLVTEYQVSAATITDDSVTAKFGGLGELNFHFGPKKGVRRCLGKLTFTGAFTFTGESEYLHIEADRAEGAKVGDEYVECPGREEEGGGVIAAGDEVHLEAIAGSTKHGSDRRVTVDEWQRLNGHWTVDISAFQTEEAEGMRIARGATVHTNASSFRHSLKAGTATLKPPAPFNGWARLTPGRGGKGIWKGTLQLPTLNGEPITLTGSSFRARLSEEEEPFDE